MTTTYNNVILIIRGKNRYKPAYSHDQHSTVRSGSIAVNKDLTKPFHLAEISGSDPNV